MGDQRSFLHFPGREPSPTLVCEGARSGLRLVIAGLGGAAAASVARDRKELEAPQREKRAEWLLWESDYPASQPPRMSPSPEAPELAAVTRWVAKAWEQCFLFALTLAPGEVLVLQPVTVHRESYTKYFVSCLYHSTSWMSQVFSLHLFI